MRGSLAESSAHSAGELAFSFNDVWKAVRRRGWIALIAAAIVAAFYYIIASSFYVPQYAATANFAVSVADSSGTSNAYNNDLVASQIAKAFPKVIGQELMNEGILQQLGWDTFPGTVTASDVAETNLITIRVTAGTAAEAFAFLGAVIDEYPQIAATMESTARLTLLSADDMPAKPYNRVTFLKVAEIGLIAGALVGAAVVLLYLIFHRTVSSAADLKQITNVKCLSEVPILPNRKKSGRTNFLITQRRVSHGFVEAIYRLRTAVERAGKQVLVVTSSLAGEGKSTVSVNLALSLAKNGKQVILIDCDLRHPLISRYLGLSESACKVGLSNYLREEIPLDRIGLKLANMNNLIIVPGGSIMKNSAEVLGEPAMEKLIGILRRQADYIVIDTPPCSVMADPAVVARYADGILYVVKEDYVSQDVVIRGIENVTMGDVPLLGFVLNEASHSSSRYGYDEYYHGEKTTANWYFGKEASK